VFGAFLIYTAIKLVREHHDPAHVPDPAAKKDGLAVRLVKKVVPTTDHYDGDRMVTRVDGRRMMTPMLLVMVAIGSTDILFALDSIPAIYGLTREPYIVFTANAFALLGLRQLYFLIGGLLERLVYLSQGLSVILGFIGVKLVLEALHTNELPFINGGEHVDWAPEIPIWLSLSVILGTLAVATVASLLATRGQRSAVRATGEDDVPAQEIVGR
jgi:tellurite resistance protein TerC